MTITGMQVVYRWETGDVVRMYSPKERKCKSKIRKLIGSYLVCFGASVLFGKSGWKTYINKVEDPDEH
jgi:hypothetical protein